jgi:hypothetical protein
LTVIEIATSRLIQVRQQINRQVLLPAEMTVSFDADRLQTLRNIIESTQNDEDFQMLVVRLPRRQLNDLFGLLLTLKPEQSVMIEQILQIIKHRATHSLALTGWAFYQQHYFNSRLSTAMTYLLDTLIAKGEKDPYLLLCHHLKFDQNLPVSLASELINQHEKLHMTGNPWKLSTQLSLYSILSDSSFYLTLLLSFFTRCPVTLIAIESDLFAYCLEHVSEEDQANLLSILYSDFRLDAIYEPVNQAVYKLFISPLQNFDHPIWTSVSKSVRLHYRQWVLIDRLNQHIQDQNRKLLFYKPLQMQIINCELIDQKIMMLEFPKYYLVDHQDFSHRAIFYDRNTYQIALESKITAFELSQPGIDCPSAKEAMLMQKRANKALMMLDEINLLFARDFIEDHTNPKKRDSVI